MAKRLCVKVDSYLKDGETKNKYMEIGVLMENDKGQYLLLDPSVNLAGVMMKQRMLDPSKQSKSVMVSVFDNDRQQSGVQQSTPPADDFSDSITF